MLAEQQGKVVQKAKLFGAFFFFFPVGYILEDNRKAAVPFGVGGNFIKAFQGFRILFETGGFTG